MLYQAKQLKLNVQTCMSVIQQNLDTKFKAAILSLMPKHYHVYRQKYFPRTLLVYVLQLAFLLCQGPLHAH